MSALRSFSKQIRARRKLTGRPPVAPTSLLIYFAGRKPASTKVSHGFRSGIRLSLASKRTISAMPGPSMAPSRRKDLLSGIMNL